MAVTTKCAAVKRLDDKHLLKQFWDYAQDTGLVTADMSNRGRRWHLVAQQPPAPREEQPKTPAPVKKEAENTAENKGGKTASELADDPFGWARKTAVEQAPPVAPPITPEERNDITLVVPDGFWDDAS